MPSADVFRTNLIDPPFPQLDYLIIDIILFSFYFKKKKIPFTAPPPCFIISSLFHHHHHHLPQSLVANSPLHHHNYSSHQWDKYSRNLSLKRYIYTYISIISLLFSYLTTSLPSRTQSLAAMIDCFLAFRPCKAGESPWRTPMRPC